MQIEVHQDAKKDLIPNLFHKDRIQEHLHLSRGSFLITNFCLNYNVLLYYN